MTKIELEQINEGVTVPSDQFLNDFIRMHELKLQGKIYEAQAKRMKHYLNRRHLVTL